MQPHTDAVLSESGVPIAGATVTVTILPGGGTPTIYSDDGITPLGSNVLTTDTGGNYAFFAANGRYNLAIAAVGHDPMTREVVLHDPSDDPGYALLAGGNSFTGAQTVAFVTLADAPSIATNAALSNNFTITLGANRELGNPTNMRDGGIYNWLIVQDGAGSRTLTYGTKFKWAGGSPPTLSTAAGARDLIVGIYNQSADVLLCTISKGFA